MNEKCESCNGEVIMDCFMTHTCEECNCLLCMDCYEDYDGKCKICYERSLKNKQL